MFDRCDARGVARNFNWGGEDKLLRPSKGLVYSIYLATFDFFLLKDKVKKGGYGTVALLPNMPLCDTNTVFEAIRITRLGIEPKSTSYEENAFNRYTKRWLFLFRRLANG